MDVDEYCDLGLSRKKLEELFGTLTGCECCNSTYDREDDKTYFFEPNEGFEVLLDDIGFSEKEKKIIYENIRCPNCGCNLDAFSEVTINEYYKEEKYHKNYIAKIASKSKTEITDFYNYLIKYPYLGCQHTIGKQIIKGIDSLEKVDLENQTFYRAREPKDSRIFVNEDMLPPDPKNIPISEGRFNHYGQAHWYLGNTEDLCGAECSHKKNCMLWFQKIQIFKSIAILDLSKEYIDYHYSPETTNYNIPIAVAALLFSGVITKEQKITGYWKPEYFITRFIADVCKTKGINGIIYPSSFYPSGKNLVIFDIKKIDFSFDGKPELREYNYKKLADEFFEEF